MDPIEIQERFEYHLPQSAFVADRHIALRAEALKFAHLINISVPKSRELSLAITKLEEALFWADAGIARNQTEES